MKKTLSQTNKDLDLRRFGKDVYSKALGEGGSGEITADDITPELLENEEVLEKIRRYGLTSLNEYPYVEITEVDEGDVEVRNCYGTSLSVVSGSLYFPDRTYYNDSSITEEVLKKVAQYDYCVIYYRGNPTVLKKHPSQYSGEISFRSIDECLEIAIGVGVMAVRTGLLDD